MAYFTNQHFELLRTLKDQKRNEADATQNRAYAELKKAYEVTEAWARGVLQKQFPGGKLKIRKRPTSQANTFLPYNWARIYPSATSPEELAYTVGISAANGFVVKIDTVGLVESSATRKAYLALRGPEDQSSPCVARLEPEAGLKMSLDELVVWSVAAIRAFTLSYADVATKLNFAIDLSDEDILKRFDGKPAFKSFRATWSATERGIFCRLARVVHAEGLDWWHVDIGTQVRFGRKNPGNDRALAVLGRVHGTRSKRVDWRRDMASGEADWQENVLNEKVVATIEKRLAAKRQALDAWLEPDNERGGLWPDQLLEEPSSGGIPKDGSGNTIPNTGLLAVNRIYYGPPGTGKTYQVSRLLKKDYEQPGSALSSDEWRRQFISEQISSLRWWELAVAVLYDRGGQGKVGEIAAHEFVSARVAAEGTNQNVQSTLWQVLNSHALEDSSTVKMKGRVSPAVVDKASDSVWHLAGDWAETSAHVVDAVDRLKEGPKDTGGLQRYRFVTFHQSYGYEEFVEGLRPVLGNEDETGSVRYEIRSGVFKDLCRWARLDPGHRYAIVIDEINRGNISKIFGELITLIEPDKREGATNEVAVTLPYSGDRFSVPPNVDVIGTMNTADRSIALLDTALRRRFEFVAVMPDSRDDADAPLAGLRVTFGQAVVDVPRMLATINERIEALYDRDHCVGHAYFTALSEVEDGEQRQKALARLFRVRILPLLEEYFFEDWEKIRLVLGDNQKQSEESQFVRRPDIDEDLTRLFGADHGMEDSLAKPRYFLNEDALLNPEAYIEIYSPKTA